MEGLFGMVGMLLLAIMFIFIPVCFLIVSWEQLKSCFQKNNRWNPCYKRTITNASSARK